MERAGPSLRVRLTLVSLGLLLATAVVLIAATCLIAAWVVTSAFHPNGTRALADSSASGPVTQAELTAQLARQRQAMQDRLTAGVLLTLLALAVLSPLLGYVVSGQVVRPLRQMAVTARRLSESASHERIARPGPRDEIRELADTFDVLLERVERASDSQRRFIAHAARELRTPLAVNRAAIEAVLAKPGGVSEPTRALGDQLLATLDRQEVLLAGLMLLASSEREPARRAPVDLAQLATGVVEQLAGAPRQAEVTVTLSAAPARVLGDQELLERCVVNLIENAVQHNTSEGLVVVTTGEAGGQAWLRVENTGAVIAPDQIGTIFEPFRRLAGDRVRSARGVGLGLAIVRAVLTAHRGTVEAVPRAGGGLVVTCRLAAQPECRPGPPTADRPTTG
ncbi:sensor histidine kinase [Kitasatospora sp. NPDC006697]|uniref:sensor histidine kinase n=1 Tax=Kitasatospora sp. NPDC006697 TaxID=3364020 RepID=UPI0036759370